MSRSLFSSAVGFKLSCVIAVVLLAGCGPTASPPATEVPTEIQSVIDGRAQVEITGDDPLYALPVGQVVDDLGNLDGCWAGWWVSTSPADFLTIHAGDPIANIYDFFHFNGATGEFVWDTYSQNLVGTYSADVLVTYRGTYAVTDKNRLALTMRSMTLPNPATGTTFTLPDEADAYVADVAASSGDMSAAEIEQMRADLVASFTNPTPWEDLVTLQGDRLRLTGVYQDEDTGVDVVSTEDDRVCVRFACP